MCILCSYWHNYTWCSKQKRCCYLMFCDSRCIIMAITTTQCTLRHQTFVRKTVFRKITNKASGGPLRSFWTIFTINLNIWITIWFLYKTIFWHFEQHFLIHFCSKMHIKEWFHLTQTYYFVSSDTLYNYGDYNYN